MEHGLLFFRITSDLIPFASHPISETFDWQDYFLEEFKEIGKFIKDHGFRISMHPDQFVLINSPSETVFSNSIRELNYHAQVLSLLSLDKTAKIQIHIGGIYGNRTESIERFILRYKGLDDVIKGHLVIENDDRLYNLKDCVQIHNETGIPILFDAFHHGVNNAGETLREAFEFFALTWKIDDGIPMVDYSSQETGARRGKHTEAIKLPDFERFISETKPFDFDIMLEIKDKEESAIKAVKLLGDDRRFIGSQG